MIAIRNRVIPGPRVVALGTFDGVHIGHRRLLETGRQLAAEEGAQLRVCTFDRHPLSVIRPGQPQELLTTLPEKLRLLAEAGAGEVRIWHFTQEMAAMPPEDFLTWLRNGTELRGVVAGWNYSFGRGGRGTPEMLCRDGQEHGYPVAILPPVTAENGEPVSSTGIREMLKQGRTEDVRELLGRYHTLSGTVVHGKEMGHLLGFPTANVAVSREKLLPAFGVYICCLETERAVLPGIVNIGRQPTLPSGLVTVEVHVLTGSPMLYGLPVRVTLMERLRPEIRFPDLAALGKQLAQDRREALERFGMGEMVGK